MSPKIAMREIDLSTVHRPILRDATTSQCQAALSPAATRLDPNSVKMMGPERNNSNASVYLIGSSTVLLNWENVTVMIGPDFPNTQQGAATKNTRSPIPPVDLEHFPSIDIMLLGHHLPECTARTPEKRLHRNLPIITSPHAKKLLDAKEGEDESFSPVEGVDAWSDILVNLPALPPRPDAGTFFPTAGRTPRLKVRALPGTHITDASSSEARECLSVGSLLGGWILELGYAPAAASSSGQEFECGYRICLSTDKLATKEISRMCDLYTRAGKFIDLMLLHFAETSASESKIPGPASEAKDVVHMMELVQPKTIVPISHGEKDGLTALANDFEREAKQAGWRDKLVHLGMREDLRFHVNGANLP